MTEPLNQASTMDQSTIQKPQPIITRQPASKKDMQIPFAFEWETPSKGTYGSLVDGFGNFFGTLGMIPCCFCCPNPYKSVDQGSVGLVTKFGELYKAVDPGLVKINIFSEKLHKVSVKIKIIEIPQQNCMTKDNVNVALTSVLYYNVVEPQKAYFSIENVANALNERTQTTLRQVVGARNLQDVIEKREEIAESIQEIIAETSDNWGVHVESILIKDLQLSTQVSQSLSMAAEAKRIGESKIITAKAEVESAKLMRKAADILASKPAMQIRYLDAMQSMAKNSNAKVIFMPSSGEIERAAPGGPDDAPVQHPDNTGNSIHRMVALQEAL